ncbi:MAG TPA: hypothetical protein VFR12_08885 [Pyrinomonadaceae bacterium]|nr:hypothetical protein [Pyrinomonadaceae bacterium]
MMKRLALLTVTFLLGCVVAFAQGDVSGKYEGSVKGTDQKVSLDLKSENGKISGRLTNGTDAMDVTEGTLKEGTLSLSFGKGATLTATVQGDKIVGDWVAGTEKRALELTKVPAAAPAAAAFDLNGNWDAVADANGQPFPFALTLKVEGETVTGGSSSQLGDSAVKSGTWKDGKLAFQLEGQNGVVTLSATVIEGKLSGEFDFAGQLQGRWVAVKKN